MTSDPPARFRDELRPSILLPSLTQGLVLGILEVVVATSFAAFIFSGPLAVHLPAGIGASLFAAVAVMGILAVTSSLPGAIGSVQDSTAAVMAIGAAAIASRLPPEAPETFLTVILAVGVTTTAAGLFFLVLGTFRLGDLIRFVPYPVIGGFLAGTGWLIAKGAVGVLTGIDVSLATLGELGTSAAAARWGPGLAFAVILLVLLRRTGRFLLIPGMVIGGAVAFYVVLAATGTSIAAAESGGWL
ncbi:MAG TPA: SulP family inorganic anion transporter, partial [Actinomycetota bacterium]|nr:SulP family inorganic anion transporter [Actinomycetota bacterium]